MNNITFEKLEFNKVKEDIKGFCISSLGKGLVDKIKPSSDINIVKRRLNENKEAKNLLNNTSHIPLEGLFNIKPILDKVEKGSVLEPSELLNVGDFLRGCKKIKKFMIENEFYASILSSYALNISTCEEIEDEIKYSIKNNKVDSNASKDLKKIRRNIEVAEDKIKERINKFLTSSSNKKYIQEFLVTKRDDKYVVPIKSSYKNEVEGAVLDVSSKGNTVFIEPKCVSKFSLDLISLKAEESVEEYRILSSITELIYNKIFEIKLNTDIISEYDMVFAKAKYSISNNCNTPKINLNGYIKIVNGRHPLLPKNSIPLNFEIGKDYQSLVITGPNAGGKTVTLKTIGILTLMTQCGFDISAENESEISIYENVFVDIGDNQSMANSLSTFSSHVKNLSDILVSSNKSTLLLLDEIGSGTEPNEGAGLAIAILEEFYKKGATTIATTHYSEIKMFAKLHPDFENAGMLFDKETLSPLYKLIIGTSQNSNALFIANKMGIGKNVIDKARNYIDNKDYNFEIRKKSSVKSNTNEEKASQLNQLEVLYEVGDKVKLLDKDDFGVVYKTRDKFNNIEVLYKEEFITVNYKKVELSIKARDLYPADYNIDSLFIDYADRKLEKDIKRGSKKALKKIQKEIKSNRELNR